MTSQPTVNFRPTRFSVSALPETHPDYRYLVLQVVLRRIDPAAGDRWVVRREPYVFNVDTSDWDFDSIPEGWDVDDWREKHEFGLAHALRLAQSLATTIDVNGKTAADAIAARAEPGPDTGGIVS